jgi:hypothetical protein
MFTFHTIFPFLKSLLSLCLGLSFAAGPQAFGGNSDGASVLDTLVPETDDLGETEESTDEGGGGDVAEGGEPHRAGQVDDGTHDPGEKPTIHADVDKVLNDLKAKDPKAWKRLNGIVQSEMKLRRDFFKLREDFPNGVTDVLALKTAIDEKLGGLDGLDNLGQEIAFYHDLDAKWEAKDPSLVKNLAAEYPDEFAAMVPHFVNQLAEVSPEAYNKFYAGWVISELRQENIPQSLYFMNESLTMAKESITDPAAVKFIDKALNVIGHMNAWVQNLGKLAATKVPDKQAASGPGKGNKEADQLAQREKAQFNREVSFDYNAYRDNLVTQQLDDLLKNRKKELTADRRQVVVDLILRNLAKKMHSAPKFRENVERFERARDKAGLLRFMKARVKVALDGENGKPGLVLQAYRTVTGETGVGGRKPGAPGGSGIPGGPGAPAGQNWIKIAKPPSPSQISRSLTEAEAEKHNMNYEQFIMKNRYVLTDGRKVYHD